MTFNEQTADDLLLDAKSQVRRAMNALDPAPTEPVATAILKVMDAVDEARKELKQRGPK